MIYLKLRQPQTTLIIALAILGVYDNSFQTSRALASRVPRSFSVAQSSSSGSPSGDRDAPNGRLGGATHAQPPARSPSDDRGAPGDRVGGATYLQPSDLPDRGLPGNREGGAVRGVRGCNRVNKPLTALMPVIREPSGETRPRTTPLASAQSVWGLTVSERPNFWFYVPYTLTSTDSIEFVLQDEQGNELYQAKFSGAQTSPGIVGVQLPSPVPPLEVGKLYHWFFFVNCGSSEPVFVEGWVQRTSLSSELQAQLEQATPQDKAKLYANNGIWFEALTTLAQLREKKLDDAQVLANWKELLESVGLQAIVSEPIMSGVSPQQ